jgi:hypothetical protein
VATFTPERHESAPAPVAPADPAGVPALPWIQLLAWAAAATAVAVFLGWKLLIPADAPAVEFVYFGQQGSAAELAEQDFPTVAIGDHSGHDGQQFYAIARHLPDLNAAGEHLDRPHYRLQRPVFAIAARLLAPSQEPDALVRSLIGVGVLSLFLGAVATGALAVTLGGKPWLAAVFPLLPGSVYSFSLSVSDNLATALALAAVAALLRSQHRAAVALGVLAVLTKEPVWLLLIGVAVWKRDRASAALVVVPAAFAGVWAVVLRVTVTDESEGINELVPPFKGLIDSVRNVTGEPSLTWVWFVLIGGIGVAALHRVGLRHPLGWAMVIQLAVFAILNQNVVGLIANANRAGLPIVVLGAVMLATARQRSAPPIGALQVDR